MQVVVDELLTHYETYGAGKKVLVLHGWGDSSLSWQDFAKHLGKSYQVIVPDLPGFGGSQSPPKAWDLTDYAQFIQKFIAKLNLEPYVVIGHSNGGAIAVRAIGRGILSPKKLVLLASAGIRAPQGRKGVYIVTKVGKVLSAPLPKSVKKRLRGRLYQQVGSDLLVSEHMAESFKLIVRDDVGADAASINIPTLLMYGDEDSATPVLLGKQLSALIQGSRIDVLPHVGHHIQQDAPEVVQGSVRDFLDA